MPVRRASIPSLWGIIGFLHGFGASLPVLSAAVALAAGLGVLIVLLAGDDTRWGSVLAATVLLASPRAQVYWAIAREVPAWDRLMFVRTVLIVGGLLVLARLGADCHEDERTAASSASL
jgi:uncharacterized membrane protein YphA (DoxX/SURF4 family)